MGRFAGKQSLIECGNDSAQLRLVATNVGIVAPVRIHRLKELHFELISQARLVPDHPGRAYHFQSHRHLDGQVAHDRCKYALALQELFDVVLDEDSSPPQCY